MESLFSKFEEEFLELLVHSAVGCIVKSVDDKLASNTIDYQEDKPKIYTNIEQECDVKGLNAFKMFSSWVHSFVFTSYTACKRKFYDGLYNNIPKCTINDLPNSDNNNSLKVNFNATMDASQNTEAEEPMYEVLFFPDAGLVAMSLEALEGTKPTNNGNNRRRNSNSFSKDGKTSSPPNTSRYSSVTNNSSPPSPKTTNPYNHNEGSVSPRMSVLLTHSTSLRPMYDTLTAAQTSIDVCVFVFTYDLLCSALLHAKVGASVVFLMIFLRFV